MPDMLGYDDVYPDGNDGTVVPMRSRASSERDEEMSPEGDISPEEGRIVSAPGDPLPNAEQFIGDLYAHDEHDRLVHHGGQFEAWSGSCWPELEDAALRSRLYAYFKDAQYFGINPKTLEKELKPFQPTRHKVADLVDALKASTYVSRDVTAPAWLLRDEELLTAVSTPERGVLPCGSTPADELIAMENGILHVPTRVLLPHTPTYYVNWALPYAYRQDVSEPTKWFEFLHDLWGEDEQSKECLQEIFGYMLSGDTRLQKLFMFVGTRRSGKGTIARVLRGMLGAANVAGPTLSSLSTQFGLAGLVGKPCAIIADARLRSEDEVIVERLLSISGEDTLSVPRKYRDDWVGKLAVRFLLISNETPRLRDSSGALSSRFVLLHFRTSFLGRENENLTDELLVELPAILNWSLGGLERLRSRRRFVQPAAALEVLRELEDLGSPMNAFLRDHCEISPYEIPIEALYAVWRSWCADQGIDKPGDVQAFGRDLRAVVPGLGTKQPSAGGGSRLRYYVGIGLKKVNPQ